MSGTFKKQVKKLAAVLTTSMLVTASSEVLQHVPCISYLVQFQGDQAKKVRALIDSSRKVNAITPAFAAKLGLSIRPTSIGAQKIDGSTLKNYGMAIAGFLIQDKSGKAQFFEEIFLLADISIEVVLRMFFLALSNADI